jgi:predicted RNA-binding Zn ribbon-like protein
MASSQTREQPREAGLSPTSYPPDDLAESLRLLAEASKSQAESMLALARSTAESVRLAAGSYVFQLRDRFDEKLPIVQIGASESSWDIDVEEWEEVRSLPNALSSVVFHAGDVLTAVVRVAVSQAVVRRVIRTEWIEVPPRSAAKPIVGAAASHFSSADGTIHLDADVSLFVEAPLEVAVGDLALGLFEARGVLRVQIGDSRPEGAISSTDVEVVIRAVVVEDEDGIALDAPDLACRVGAETRSYWLDKAERLPLQLPKL